MELESRSRFSLDGESGRCQSFVLPRRWRRCAGALLTGRLMEANVGMARTADPGERGPGKKQPCRRGEGLTTYPAARPATVPGRRCLGGRPRVAVPSCCDAGRHRPGNARAQLA